MHVQAPGFKVPSQCPRKHQAPRPLHNNQTGAIALTQFLFLAEADPWASLGGGLTRGFLMRETCRWDDSNLKRKLLFSFSGDSVLQE